MKRMLFVVLGCVCFASLTGCAGTAAHTVGHSREAFKDQKANDGGINVYLAPGMPRQLLGSVRNAYPITAAPLRLSIVQKGVVRSGPKSTWKQVLSDAKAQARSCGAEAVVVRRWTTSTKKAKSIHFDLVRYPKKRVAYRARGATVGTAVTRR